MPRFWSSAVALLILTIAVHAQTPPVAAPDAAELTSLLNQFLAGASRNNVAMHDRFWAEDVIYTGSGGRRRGKADIMKDSKHSLVLAICLSSLWTSFARGSKVCRTLPSHESAPKKRHKSVPRKER